MKGPGSYPNPLLRPWCLGEGIQSPNLHYLAMRRFLQVIMCAMWKIRAFNRHHEPADGGVVYICNHQSYLDPILMGIALRRPMNYMAREDLFHLPVFKQLIRSLNAFSVRRATADIAALKEALRRLKNGGQVAIFAEGTRTYDGRIGTFLPGVAMLAQRAAKWTVPVLIDGAFEAWPRWQAMPSPGSVVVQYGEPIPQEEVRKYKADEFVERVRQTLIAIQRDVRRRVGRPTLKYD